MIKDIKLSPKRGGHGHITSYTINIGSAEARECGFLDSEGNALQLEKFIDLDNKEIIIRIKAED